MSRFLINKKAPYGVVADPTILELATSAVTGQRSNQVSYESTREDYIVFDDILQARKNLCYNGYNMKDIGKGFLKIFREEKGLLVAMVLLLMTGIALGLHTFFHFKAGGTTMYIGYSDIGKFSGGEWLSLWNSGGYRTGGWAEMAVFPILGLAVGVLHNMFAIQVYTRRGKGYAQIVVLISFLILAGAFTLLLRLLGEV